MERNIGTTFPALNAAIHRRPRRYASQGRDRSHRLHSRATGSCNSMTNRATSADFVTAFATGWPEKQPDLMVLSLTTHKGVQDFAFSKEQALLVAKTMKRTAEQLATSKPAG